MVAVKGGALALASLQSLFRMLFPLVCLASWGLLCWGVAAAGPGVAPLEESLRGLEHQVGEIEGIVAAFLRKRRDIARDAEGNQLQRKDILAIAFLKMPIDCALKTMMRILDETSLDLEQQVTVNAVEASIQRGAELFGRFQNALVPVADIIPGEYSDGSDLLQYAMVLGDADLPPWETIAVALQSLQVATFVGNAARAWPQKMLKALEGAKATATSSWGSIPKARSPFVNCLKVISKIIFYQHNLVGLGPYFTCLIAFSPKVSGALLRDALGEVRAIIDAVVTLYEEYRDSHEALLWAANGSVHLFDVTPITGLRRMAKAAHHGIVRFMDRVLALPEQFREFVDKPNLVRQVLRLILRFRGVSRHLSNLALGVREQQDRLQVLCLQTHPAPVQIAQALQPRRSPLSLRSCWDHLQGELFVWRIRVVRCLVAVVQVVSPISDLLMLYRMIKPKPRGKSLLCGADVTSAASAIQNILQIVDSSTYRQGPLGLASAEEGFAERARVCCRLVQERRLEVWKPFVQSVQIYRIYQSQTTLWERDEWTKLLGDSLPVILRQMISLEHELAQLCGFDRPPDDFVPTCYDQLVGDMVRVSLLIAQLQRILPEYSTDAVLPARPDCPIDRLQGGCPGTKSAHSAEA